MNKLIWGITLVLLPIFMSAQTLYKLSGTIGDYPVVIELEDLGEDQYSGRYAYKSTLKRDGDVDCSWLSIFPNLSTPDAKWDVRDCKGKIVETWFNPTFIDHKYLTARMSNIKGKSYDIVATVSGQSKEKEPLNPYYRQHIGEKAGEFDMFNSPKIQTRLQNMMGIFDYIALKDISMTEMPIEYHNGMYWAYGFTVPQDYDPATVWAYDTYTNSFYVWIRKDGRDYWWSESGNIPFKFREIVRERF